MPQSKCVPVLSPDWLGLPWALDQNDDAQPQPLWLLPSLLLQTRPLSASGADISVCVMTWPRAGQSTADCRSWQFKVPGGTSVTPMLYGLCSLRQEASQEKREKWFKELDGAPKNTQTVSTNSLIPEQARVVALVRERERESVCVCVCACVRACERERVRARALIGVFKTSQPQGIILGMKETFIKRYVVERTSKADIRPEEESQKTESCRENLWNEIQLKGPYSKNRYKNRKKQIGLWKLC